MQKMIGLDTLGGQINWLHIVSSLVIWFVVGPAYLWYRVKCVREGGSTIKALLLILVPLYLWLFVLNFYIAVQ